MTRLAVTTQAETFERMQAPLAERGIDVVAVQPSERTMALDDDPFPSVDVGFVYPSRIMEGDVVDASLAVPWVNDREAILRSRNKAGAIRRLSAAGLPVPETVMVSNPADEEAVAAAVEALGTPLVVKPNSTTRGLGVTRVPDLDAATGVVDYLDLIHEYPATGDRSYLLQAFVPDARDVRAMVVDGCVVGAVERRQPAGEDRWKHNVHRGARADPVELSADQRALAERAAAALDVDYLGVDLLIGSDRTVVSETNARPTIDDASKYDDGFWDDLAGLIRDRVPGE